MDNELTSKGKAVKKAARILAAFNTTAKNKALEVIAETIMEQEPIILEANDRDIEAGQAAGLDEALLNRLLLTPPRLESMSNDVKSIINLPDPVGREFESRRLPNGLHLSKRRIPIGVIGVIYESRPHVTIDISALCLKSGNGAILRSGEESIHSNRALVGAVQAGCRAAGLPAASIQLIESTERSLAKEMLHANGLIDMIITHGRADLHQFAIHNATVPVITSGLGLCRLYVDAAADLAKVVPIAVNAKVQRFSGANALDTLLIHQTAAPHILPRLADAWIKNKVELRCEARALAILKDHPAIKPAGPNDFYSQFLGLIVAVKVVDNIEQALDHIYTHGAGHTEAIITENYSSAQRFVDEVNSAVVMVNASPRFNDGRQFGLGAEVAISTQPLHARGPMGLKELTTYKWLVLGAGQIRP